MASVKWGIDRDSYSPPGAIAGNITNLGVYPVAGDEGNYKMLGGINVKQSSGKSSGYTVVLPTHQTPPHTGTDIYNAGVYSLTNIGVKQSNPIVQVFRKYSADRYLCVLRFYFKSGTRMDFIPEQTESSGDTSFNFFLKPRKGYFLSSVWVGWKVYRQFARQEVQLIVSINDTTTERYTDTNQVSNKQLQGCKLLNQIVQLSWSPPSEVIS